MQTKYGDKYRQLMFEERISYTNDKGFSLTDPEKTWENQLQLHPLFGYVGTANVDRNNNFGFATPYNFGLGPEGYYLEGVNVTDPFVIGIFGGSFASDTAIYAGKYLENKLKEHFTRSNPIVVNLAIGGHAIPQSAFIFTYFSSMLDIAIFIDGLNEPWNYLENNLSGYPPEYAKASHYNYKISINSLSAERFLSTQKIINAQGVISFVTRTSIYPIIKELALTHYLWLLFKSKFENKILVEQKKIEDSYVTNETKFYDIDNIRMIEISAQQWKRYHLIISHLSSLMGILDVHVLQPNPYIPGSKAVMTDSETLILKEYKSNSIFAVQSSYPLLRQYLEELTGNNGIYLDMTNVFLNEKGQIWVDPHHTNRKGSILIMDLIYQEISKRIREHEKRD